jgi:hypothetical protein
MKKVLIAAGILAVANLAPASEGDELTSLSYISYLERYATVLPANQEETIEAVINMPLAAGDRIDTAREGRMEVMLSDGNTLWLDEYTAVSLDAVAFSRDIESERTVLFIADGSVLVEISEYALSSKPMRIDSRGATVHLTEPGLYRLESLPSGGLRLEVQAGLAEASTTAGGVLVRAETAAEVGGGEVQRSEAVISWGDDFTAWVEARRQVTAGESAKHVDLRYSRHAAQLDNYGSWVYEDSINSWAWQPTVSTAWRPYTAGRWYWTRTGYAWLSYEPWGWLPYHYGSWHLSARFGWVWSWGNFWGPAWVSWMWWPGHVGWCPFGFYNTWYWNRFPPHRPSHPGGGTAMPRGDVVPPRTASARIGGDASQVPAGAQPALDLNGRVRLASVDRRGWTVVRQEDFTSPSLTRLAKPADRVMPSAGDQTGVVMTGPLTTRAPYMASQPGEIERVFRGVERQSPTDLSPLLARDSSLSPELARRIGQRTTVAELLGRRPAEPAAGAPQSISPRLSTGAASPFASTAGTRVQTVAQPNLYRPTAAGSVAGSAAAPPRSLSGGAVRQPVAPRSSAGRVGASSRPVIVPPTGSSTLSRSPVITGAGPSGVRSPSAGAAPSSGSPSSVRRSPAGSTAPRSSTVGSSPPQASSPSRSSAGAVRPSGGGSRPSGATARPSGGSGSGSPGAKKR